MGQTFFNDLQQKSPIQHPVLSKGKVSGSGRIILTYKKDNKMDEYCKKVKSINLSNTFTPILIPKIIQAKEQKLFGVESTISVLRRERSFFTKDIILLYLWKSKEEKQIKSSSHKPNSGFSCSTYFQHKNGKSGDIRPKNVLINQNGKVSLIHYLSFPDQQINYYKSLHQNEITYLAPQQLSQLQEQIIYRKSNSSIAQSFSIGLTMIDVCLLTDCEEIYCCDPISFNTDLFQDKLIAFKNMNLSPFLSKTIHNLLEIQANSRPSPGESHAIIKPYEKEIIEHRPFTPNRQKSSESLLQYQTYILS